jgi:hypothetical protein
MDRNLAKAKTIEKFTNLLDGCTMSNITVSQVINYYDALILGVPTDNPRRIDGIIANFMEDYVNSLDHGEHIL